MAVMATPSMITTSVERSVAMAVASVVTCTWACVIATTSMVARQQHGTAQNDTCSDQCGLPSQAFEVVVRDSPIIAEAAIRSFFMSFSI